MCVQPPMEDSSRSACFTLTSCLIKAGDSFTKTSMTSVNGPGQIHERRPLLNHHGEQEALDDVAVSQSLDRNGPPSNSPESTNRREPSKTIWNRDFGCLLLATLMFAVSDALITTFFQSSIKEIICCEKLNYIDSCHDEKWCDDTVGSVITSELSALTKWQTISNAGFGESYCAREMQDL